MERFSLVYSFSFCLQTGLVFAQQIRVVATFPDLGRHHAADRQRAGQMWRVWPQGSKILHGCADEAELRAEIESR